MKTNKLGIPITESNYIIDGHSINKYKYILKDIVCYYRLFKLNKPNRAKVYGIHMKKKNINNVHNK